MFDNLFETAGGESSSRLVQFLNVSLSPSPIRAPGRARLTTLVNVTERLPMTLSADVSVSKYFYVIPLKIPCFSNIGTWYVTGFHIGVAF